MKIGDIICAKSIEHRDPVEIKEDKNGKQRVIANRFGFKFQSEANLISTVGVFVYLGTFPERTDNKVYAFAEAQLRRLGWTQESATPNPARFTPLEEGKALGSATQSSSQNCGIPRASGDPA